MNNFLHKPDSTNLEVLLFIILLSFLNNADAPIWSYIGSGLIFGIFAGIYNFYIVDKLYEVRKL